MASHTASRGICGAGQYRQEPDYSLCGLVYVLTFANGLKRSITPSRLNAASLMTVVLITVPHINDPGEAAGIQHIAKDTLRQK